MEKSQSTIPISRRRFVRGLSAAGVASIGMSSTVSASVNEGTIHIGDGTVEMVSGRESNKAAADARAAESFRELRQHLQHEYKYLVDVSEESVASVKDPKGEIFHVVSFDVMDRGSKSTVPGWQASVAVVLQNGQAIRTKGVVVIEPDSKLTLNSQNSHQKTMTTIKVVDGDIHEESTQVPDKESLTEDTGVTIQATPASCSQCVAIATAFYSIGCGYGVAFVCSAAGLATIGVGGVVCAAVGYAVCSVSGRNARAACQVINDC